MWALVWHGETRLDVLRTYRMLWKCKLDVDKFVVNLPNRVRNKRKLGTVDSFPRPVQVLHVLATALTSFFSKRSVFRCLSIKFLLVFTCSLSVYLSPRTIARRSLPPLVTQLLAPRHPLPYRPCPARIINKPLHKDEFDTSHVAAVKISNDGIYTRGEDRPTK